MMYAYVVVEIVYLDEIDGRGKKSDTTLIKEQAECQAEQTEQRDFVIGQRRHNEQWKPSLRNSGGSLQGSI